MHATIKEQEGNYRLGNLINQNPIHKVELGTYVPGTYIGIQYRYMLV